MLPAKSLVEYYKETHIGLDDMTNVGLSKQMIVMNTMEGTA